MSRLVNGIDVYFSLQNRTYESQFLLYVFHLTDNKIELPCKMMNK